MVEQRSGDKASKNTEKEAAQAKKAKASIDPAQRGKGGFDRSILRGKAPIFRTLKKAGR